MAALDKGLQVPNPCERVCGGEQVEIHEEQDVLHGEVGGECCDLQD